MKLILFLDDRGGMLFNRRRQSQDRKAREFILSLTKDHALYMNAYSLKQFETKEGILLSETPQRDAGKDDYVLIEDLTPTLTDVNEAVLILWNRHYPSDRRFDRASLEKEGFSLVDSLDFAGHSHEKITVLTYRRT